MFWRKKQPAWYWKVIIVFVVLRIMYAFAKLFMKTADAHAAKQGLGLSNKKH
jgi:hypothetical protein